MSQEDVKRLEREIQRQGKDVLVFEKKNAVVMWSQKTPQGGFWGIYHTRKRAIAELCWNLAENVGRESIPAGEHGDRYDPATWRAIYRAGYRVVRVLVFHVVEESPDA